MYLMPDRCGEYKYNDDQLYVSTWVMSLMRAGVDPLVADAMIFCWESGTS